MSSVGSSTVGLSDRKINLPHSRVKLPPCRRRTARISGLASSREVDYIAASFIRRADGILAIKHYLRNGRGYFIIAKINQKG